MKRIERPVPFFDLEAPMNAFAQAQQVEALAMNELMPWLTLKFSPVEKCENEFLQRTLGDFTITQNTLKRSVELKAEQRFTGNLFLEVWSNRPARTLGWLYTSRADILAYYFCDNRQLYVFSLPALQDWAFGVGAGNGAIYQFPEKHQNKYNQLNYSFGRVTPIEAITRGGVPMKLFRAEDRKH
jgi:hypothetical protein